MLKTRSYFTPDYLSARLKPLISKENFCLLLWLSLMHYALGYQFKFIYVFSSLSGLLLLRYAGKRTFRAIVVTFTVAGLRLSAGILYCFGFLVPDQARATA